jgi:polyphosphate kinase
MGLRRGRQIGVRIPHAVPHGNRLRPGKTVGAKWRRGEWDPEEHGCPIIDAASHFPRLNACDWLHGPTLWSVATELTGKQYEAELERLQLELLYLQEWIHYKGLRVAVVFEGRDTAGKGGVIKRITEPLNPRYYRTVALAAPTDRERSQWYYQRYIAHLPAAGEMVLFDRSWYNRAGVERVMGFCTDEEYHQFLRDTPWFERSLIESGIILVKYWLSVSDEEQEQRFRKRIDNPNKRWKLSTIDLQARAHWVDYSEAKDEMFSHTDTDVSPWWVVEGDDKKSARLNLISHLLSLIPYEHVPSEPIKLPRRQQRKYQRPPKGEQRMVPERYVVS